MSLSAARLRFDELRDHAKFCQRERARRLLWLACVHGLARPDRADGRRQVHPAAIERARSLVSRRRRAHAAALENGPLDLARGMAGQHAHASDRCADVGAERSSSRRGGDRYGRSCRHPHLGRHAVPGQDSAPLASPQKLATRIRLPSCAANLWDRQLSAHLSWWRSSEIDRYVESPDFRFDHDCRNHRRPSRWGAYLKFLTSLRSGCGGSEPRLPSFIHRMVGLSHRSSRNA